MKREPYPHLMNGYVRDSRMSLSTLCLPALAATIRTSWNLRPILPVMSFTVGLISSFGNGLVVLSCNCEYEVAILFIIQKFRYRSSKVKLDKNHYSASYLGKYHVFHSKKKFIFACSHGNGKYNTCCLLPYPMVASGVPKAALLILNINCKWSRNLRKKLQPGTVSSSSSEMQMIMQIWQCT